MVTLDPGAASFDRWIGQHAGPIRPTLALLRQIISEAAPHLEERVIRGLPTWVGRGPVCYLDGNGLHARIGFFRGAELRDLEGRLEVEEGRLRHLQCQDVDDVPVAFLRRLLREAAALDAGP